MLASEMVGDGVTVRCARRISSGDGAGIPEIGGKVVARNAGASFVEPSKVSFSTGEALGSGEADPCGGVEVHRNTFATIIENAEVVLRCRIVLIGGSEKPASTSWAFRGMPSPE